VKPATASLLLIVPLMLGGCGLVRQAEMAKAKEQLTAAMAECKAQNPNSLVLLSDCYTAAEDTIWRPYVRYGDLQTLMQAQRKVLAAKVDHGELTKDEANLELAQVASAIRQQELERDNSAGMVAAQRSAASAQMLGASAAFLQATRPQPVLASPAPIVNTSCNRVGTFTNCTSY
jgi:hypothetical protein